MRLRILILVMLLNGFNAFAEEAVINSEEAIVNAEDNVIIKGDYEFLNNLEFWFFIFGCGLISILVKIVDYAITIKEMEATEKIKIFTKTGSLLEWLLWFLSASIVGFLGNLVGLFQASAQAAVVIGLGWPTVYSQLKQKYGPPSDNKEIVKRPMRVNNEGHDIDENEVK